MERRGKLVAFGAKSALVALGVVVGDAELR
jgi:hypothetical protein